MWYAVSACRRYCLHSSEIKKIFHKKTNKNELVWLNMLLLLLRLDVTLFALRKKTRGVFPAFWRF